MRVAQIHGASLLFVWLLYWNPTTAAKIADHATLFTATEHGDRGVLAELENRRDFAPGHGLRAVVHRLQLCASLVDVGYRVIQDRFAGQPAVLAIGPTGWARVFPGRGAAVGRWLTAFGFIP
jgi:hypothetical protein